MSEWKKAAVVMIVTIVAAALILLLAGCGGPEPRHGTGAATVTVTAPVPTREIAGCPEADEGHGQMGECSPPAGPTLRSFRPGPITYPDRSNNDPVTSAGMRAIAAHGHPGIVLKANQGTRFVDSTFVPMARAAKAAHICVGGYDFDEIYTVSEVETFRDRLHAAGIFRNTPCTFPPTLDVEFGAFNLAGLERQIAFLKREFGRVKLYTGEWYIGPRVACQSLFNLARKLTFWLSGYPIAPVPCGTASSYLEHQYTDQGFDGAGPADMTTFLGTRAAFTKFAQKGLTKAQQHAANVSALKHAKAKRAELHRDIEAHLCRKGQHNLPRTPHRLRLKYHKLCGRWIKRGGVEIATIHRLEKALRQETR